MTSNRGKTVGRLNAMGTRLKKISHSRCDHGERSGFLCSNFALFDANEKDLFDVLADLVLRQNTILHLFQKTSRQELQD